MHVVLSGRLRLTAQVWGVRNRPSTGSSGFFVRTDIDPPMDQYQATLKSQIRSFASLCINQAFDGRTMNY